MAPRIEWRDATASSPWKVPTFEGYIGPLRVATVHTHRSDPVKWVVWVHLKPLPDRLDDWTLKTKASERSAKACAQRVVNEFTKLLNGESA
jgi:hypothetical protein